MSTVKRRRTENDDEPVFDTQYARVLLEGVLVIKEIKARMSIRRMIPLDLLHLDLSQSSSLWIGLNPGLPSRG